MEYQPFLMGFGVALFLVAALMYVFCEPECASCLFNDIPFEEEWTPEDSGTLIPQEQEMSSVDKETTAIFEDAFKRYKLGESRYGVFDKDTDPRDFLLEGEEELLDLMVYANFEIARIRALKKRIRSVLDASYPSPWGMP